MIELDDDTRARLALIPSPQALTAAGLEIEDLTDPDARSVAIRAEHPELDEALADGRDRVTVASHDRSRAPRQHAVFLPFLSSPSR